MWAVSENSGQWFRQSVASIQTGAREAREEGEQVVDGASSRLQ